MNLSRSRIGLKLHSQQRGVALITVLIMVALATILAATIAKRQANTVENTAYLIRQDQSLLYAEGAETFFSELLVFDAKQTPKVDHLSEIWAKPMPSYPVANGQISGYLQDESGKFNLNNLVNADDTANTAAQQWFERLLVRVGLPAGLSQAVIDWQDNNDQTEGPMGAENSYYLGLQQPYLAANRKFYSIDELKQVRGFEGKNFQLIQPYISALPSTQITKLNINTAPAIVLASMDAQLDLNAITDQLKARQAKLEYFSNVNELWGLSVFQAMSEGDKQSKISSLLGVQSDYFTAYITVVLDQHKRQFMSRFMRKNKQVYMYMRSTVPFSSMSP